MAQHGGATKRAVLIFDAVDLNILHPHLAQELGSELRRLLHPGLVECIGGDRRDTDQGLEIGAHLGESLVGAPS